MAIIVEDGTGLANAQSYVSVAEANTYHSARGNSTWTGTDALKEQALVRATAALDGGYLFRGYKATSYQALGWPRSGAIDDDGYSILGVPVKLEAATCEASILELVTPGALTESLARGGAVTREKVGSLEVSYSPAASNVTRYRAIDGPLAGLINGKQGGVSSMRITRG